MSRLVLTNGYQVVKSRMFKIRLHPPYCGHHADNNAKIFGSFNFKVFSLSFQFNFTIAIDPKPVKVNTTNQTALAVKHEIDTNGSLKIITNATKEKFTFEDIPIHLQ